VAHPSSGCGAPAGENRASFRALENAYLLWEEAPQNAKRIVGHRWEHLVRQVARAGAVREAALRAREVPADICCARIYVHIYVQICRPRACRLAHKMQVGQLAFLWEYSDKRLRLAQLLGQLGVFLTWYSGRRPVRPGVAPAESCTCTGWKAPFWAVARPARPHKGAIRKLFTAANAGGD
jgi:hypothetical protein